MVMFSRTPEEESVGYCLYHSGYLHPANIRKRNCVEKRCKACVLFGTAPFTEAQKRKVGRTFKGDAEDFEIRFRRLITLRDECRKMPAEDDEPDDEPDIETVMRKTHHDTHERAKRLNKQKKRRGFSKNARQKKRQKNNNLRQ